MSKLELLKQDILALTVNELRELNRMLSEGGGEAVGVREPRRPRPPLDARGVSLDAPEGKIGDEIANDLPEDYWETAQ